MNRGASHIRGKVWYSHGWWIWMVTSRGKEIASGREGSFNVAFQECKCATDSLHGAWTFSSHILKELL